MSLFAGKNEIKMKLNVKKTIKCNDHMKLLCTSMRIIMLSYACINILVLWDGSRSFHESAETSQQLCPEFL